jgi:hypothetical protein
MKSIGAKKTETGTQEKRKGEEKMKGTKQQTVKGENTIKTDTKRQQRENKKKGKTNKRRQ